LDVTIPFATGPRVKATEKVVQTTSAASEVRTSGVVESSPESWNAKTRNVAVTTLMGSMGTTPLFEHWRDGDHRRTVVNGRPPSVDLPAGDPAVRPLGLR
jgi:hypothetical protein